MLQTPKLPLYVFPPYRVYRGQFTFKKKNSTEKNITHPACVLANWQLASPPAPNILKIKNMTCLKISYVTCSLAYPLLATESHKLPYASFKT